MSKKIVITFFITMFTPFGAFAEGMDCTKAKIETEKLICSHSALYDLDRQMGEAFRKTKKIVEDQGKNEERTLDDFMASHKEWLSAVRKLPTDMKNETESKKVEAITSKYKERLSSLKIINLLNLPYTDQRANDIAPLIKDLEQGSQMLLYTLTSGNDDVTTKVSCDLFKTHPEEAVYGFDAQFGSSMDNFIPLCDDALSKDIAQLDKLLNHAKDISMSFKGQPCTGTIANMFIRSSLVDDLLAKYNPTYRVSDDIKKDIPVSVVVKGKVTPELLLKPFASWAKGSAWQQMTYNKMLPQAMPAYEAVKKYYEDKGLVAKKDIPLYAAYTVAGLVSSYASETIQPVGESENQKAEFKPLSSDNPVMRAVGEGNEKMLRAVLNKKGVDVNKQNSFGETALILAIQSGKPELVKILLSAGADINKGTMAVGAEDYDKQIEACNRPYGYMGQSPLMIAVRYGSTVEIIKLLLDAGANVKTKNSDNKTAFDYIDEANFSDTDKKQIKALLK